ncbi:hypothetical protein NDU88_005977 [Pleurodeles waltl]|uniref:Uncharacterized protein n=1 Tax=Pleurodeles waltl TaxID=8319 RepID=A0AAV7TVH2_PLEWA|nr:hypothetical protein NDU88_005977 [Pleurodeles waltl]
MSSDEPSEHRNQCCRNSIQQVAHDIGRVFPEAGKDDQEGGNTENQATLWGERGLGSYPTVCGSKRSIQFLIRSE